MSETYDLDVIKGDVKKLVALADIAKKPEEIITALEEKIKDYRTTNAITDLRKQVEANVASTYAAFEQEMKASIDKGTFITGYKELDNLICFAPGDFIILQAMSNHGKSAFIGNLVHRFLTMEENQKKNPVVIWVTYESSIRKIKHKLLNTISSYLQSKKIICRDRAADMQTTSSHYRHGDFLFGHVREFEPTITTYDGFTASKSLYLLQNIQLDCLQTLIASTKKQCPDRPIILFLDYFQIIRNTLPGEDGWQKIKLLAYWLERFAIDNDIVLFAGSQVNDQGDPREGKDIFNACTIDLDLFNHSHPKLQDNEKLSKRYLLKRNGKDIISITIDKAKDFECRELKEYLLFDGYRFEENPGCGQACAGGLIPDEPDASAGNRELNVRTRRKRRYD